MAHNVSCMSSGTYTHFKTTTPLMCHCLYTVLGAVVFLIFKLKILW